MTDVAQSTVRTTRIQTYAVFWHYYLREHARSRTRAIHVLGTVLSTFCLLMLAITGSLWYLPMALAAGYGPAWSAHAFVENNHPATLAYPLWSLLSDYRMAWLWATRRLEGELARACVKPR